MLSIQRHLRNKLFLEMTTKNVYQKVCVLTAWLQICVFIYLFFFVSYVISTIYAAAKKIKDQNCNEIFTMYLGIFSFLNINNI